MLGRKTQHRRNKDAIITQLNGESHVIWIPSLAVNSLEQKRYN
jgi:hypothetical protein